MENSGITSRDSHLNRILDIPKGQIVRLSRMDNLNYGHLSVNAYTVGESMRKEKVASLDFQVFKTCLKISERQCVTPELFQVNASSGFKQPAAA